MDVVAKIWPMIVSPFNTTPKYCHVRHSPIFERPLMLTAVEKYSLTILDAFLKSARLNFSFSNRFRSLVRFVSASQDSERLLPFNSPFFIE
jgi:hypothetical protein